MAPIRVLLADDHAIFLEALRSLLSEDREIRVVGEATDGLEALSAAEVLQPDILLLDVQMPGVGGLEVLSRIRQKCPKTKVLILSGFSDEHLVAEALRQGASGYLWKTLAYKDLLKAIRATHSGDLWAERRVLTEVLKSLREKVAILNAPSPESRTILTARDREIVEWVGQGKTYEEIGAKLGISEKTVETHLNSIFGKFKTGPRFHWIADHMDQLLTWEEDEDTSYAQMEGL